MPPIPLKTASDPRNGLETAMKDYIAYNYHNCFSEPELRQVNAAFRSFDQLRQQSIALSNAQTVSEQSLNTLLSYYTTICELDRRFPFRPYKSGFFSKKSTSIMTDFSWQDAFAPNRSCMTSHDANLEKAAILFNSGAVFTHLAENCDFSNSESSKLASQYYRRASGVFQVMEETMEYSFVGSHDLTVHCYRFLKQLTFAQSLGANYSSAGKFNLNDSSLVSKSLSPDTLSKLASAAAAEFDSVRSLVASSALGDWLKRAHFDWGKYAAHQEKYYQALAQLEFASVEAQRDAYGDEIARLLMALNLCKEISKFKFNLIFRGRVSVSELKEQIEKRLSVCEKDNDTIYHYKVPSQDTLAPVPSKVIGAPIPLELPQMPLDSIFNRMIPNATRILVDEWMESVEECRKRYKAASSEQTDIVHAMLASQNLPGALEAVESNEKIPNSLWNGIHAIQLKSSEYLHEQQKNVAEIAKSCFESFKRAQDMLENEVSCEKAMRQQFGLKWDRASSEEVSAEYHRGLGQARKYLKQAQEADLRVEDALKRNGKGLAFLHYEKQRLEAMIPVVPSAMASEDSLRLRQLLDDISRVIELRESILDEFERTFTEENMIHSVITASDEVSAKSIIKKEKVKMENVWNKLSQTFRDQEKLLEDISRANEEFIRNRSDNPQVKAKREILQMLNIALETWLKIERELQSGFKFYSDLLVNCLDPLHQSVSDFCAARQNELEMVKRDLDGTGSSPISNESEVEASAPDDISYPSYL